MNPTISVCNIVKNEERQIEDFLLSLADFADEIIIVDTGSSDNTVKKIEKHIIENDNVRFYKYDFEEVFHYGKAKNFSINKATKDYIIILDSDERLSEDFKKKVRNFLKDKKNEVFKIKRADECVKHLFDFPERIIKNNLNIFYNIDADNMVHESLNHNKESFIFDEIVWHRQRENHYIYRPQRILFQLELQIERTPKTKSLLGHILRGLWYSQFRFRKLFFKRRLYKDGKLGFKYAFMRALDAFLIEFFVGLKPKDSSRCWKK